MKRSILSMLLATTMSGLGSYAVPPHRRSYRTSHQKTAGTAGSKMMRRAEAGTLRMRHPGGVVSQTFRDMQQRNFQNPNV